MDEEQLIAIAKTLTFKPMTEQDIENSFAYPGGDIESFNPVNPFVATTKDDIEIIVCDNCISYCTTNLEFDYYEIDKIVADGIRCQY